MTTQWLTELALLEQQRILNGSLRETDRKPVPTYHQMALLMRVVGAMRGHEPTRLHMDGPGLSVSFDTDYGRLRVTIMTIREDGNGRHSINPPKDTKRPLHFDPTPHGDEFLLAELGSWL